MGSRMITTHGYARKLQKSVVIAHPVDVVVGVVSNVSEFPRFLPFCYQSAVVEDSIRSDQHMEMFDCVLGFRHMHVEERIKHRVRVDKSSRRVQARANDSVHFHSIQYDWTFDQIEDNISKASLDLHLDMKSMLHAMTFDVMRESIEMKVFEAFMKRVDEVSTTTKP